MERAVADSFKPAAFLKGYAGKAWVGVGPAIHMERAAADRRYACGDGYAGKAGAKGERLVADSFKLASCLKCYGGKTATVKSIPPNAGNAFGDGYTGKASLTGKSTPSNAGNAVGYGYAGNLSLYKSASPNAGHRLAVMGRGYNYLTA